VFGAVPYIESLAERQGVVCVYMLGFMKENHYLIVILIINFNDSNRKSNIKIWNIYMQQSTMKHI
jgi:hypothetical protein